VLFTKTSVNAADEDYDKLTNFSAVSPSASVHAARLNSSRKILADAEGAAAFRDRQRISGYIKRLTKLNPF